MSESQIRPNGDLHWYGKTGWRILRESVVRRAEPHFEGFLVALQNADADVEALTRSFFERVAKDILERQRIDRSTKWSYGVSLLGDAGQLASMIRDDRLLRGAAGIDGLPIGLLRRTFRHFLERARRSLSGATNNRVLIWEKLDRVSQEVMKEDAALGIKTSRLSRDHLLKVQERYGQLYKINKNSDFNPGKLLAFFEEFAEEARVVFDPLDPKSADLVAALMRDTGVAPSVRVCVDRLRRNDPGAFEAWSLAVEADRTSGKEVLGFAAEIGVSRYEIEKRIRAATAQLGDCINRSLSFIFGRRS
ncbi:hypothetical protein MPL1032_10213 [Mesorhizobium plurifarium]|uniref:Uncharacterized protein n=1 Tax=Mesorhizobium plurifarium TaxID=69974 RepID=A0A0K2VMP2_MESPL|nr:hypothetical protein MPL1032_10213 [Mesorhizobium plurifarium]